VTKHVQCLAVSPDGTRLAVGTGLWTEKYLRHGMAVFEHLTNTSTAGEVYLWDLVSGQLLRTVEGFPNGVTGLAFSPDGSRLAIAGRGVPALVLDMATLNPVQQLSDSDEGSVRWPAAVAFSPDGATLVGAVGSDTFGRRGAARWDARTGRLLGTDRWDGDATEVRFSPDGRTLAVVRNKDVLLTGRWPWQRHELAGHEQAPLSLAFSPDGRRVTTGFREIKVWDVGTGREVLTLDGLSKHLVGLSFSPDGRLLAVAADGETRTWDGRERPEPPAPPPAPPGLPILRAAELQLLVLVGLLFLAVCLLVLVARRLPRLAYRLGRLVGWLTGRRAGTA
jgi:WD40 repeat protein